MTCGQTFNFTVKESEKRELNLHQVSSVAVQTAEDKGNKAKYNQ